MQDGARPHTARVTIQHLNNSNILRLMWPAKSLDLNLIVKVWVALDDNLKKRPVPLRTRAELAQPLMEE